MSYEIEAKYRIEQFPPLINLLGDMGAKRRSEMTLVDTYYGPERHPGDVLRLRLSSNFQAEFGYKSGRHPDESGAGLKVREEIECGVDNPRQFDRILRKMGYSPSAIVEKFRVTYTLDHYGEGFVIALDKVKDLGNFVEIEQVVYSTEDYLGNIPSLAKDLGLTDMERRSYAELR